MIPSLGCLCLLALLQMIGFIRRSRRLGSHALAHCFAASARHWVAEYRRIALSP